MALDPAGRRASPGEREGSPRPRSAVSRRAVIIGLLLVPPNVFWVLFAELRWYYILTLNPLFVTPIFDLLALVVLNALLRRYAPRWVLSGAELVTIYVMLVMSCAIATHDFIINPMSTLGWPRWAADAQNNWEHVMFPHLPRWLYVWDRGALQGAFAGNSSPYRLEVLRAWLPPLAFWTAFILSIGWTTLCLTVIVRRAWVDDTRLAFPIVRLPMALTEEATPGSILTSRALWYGFATAATVCVLNGLREWFPVLPALETRAQWIHFTDPAWQRAEGICYTLYPFAIGLAFLVPLDVSFSCWFFYLFMKAQAVVGYWLGYGDVPDFPYVSEQGIGAWYAFGFILLWTTRHYLAGVLRAAWRGDSRGEGEPMSYRLAVLGAMGGMAVFSVFWWQAGMSPLWVLVVMVTYFLLALCITRVRAEAGGQHTVWDLEPLRLFRLFDSRMLGPGNLAGAACSHWYWRLNRSHPMPSQLEAFRLAQEHGVELRSLVKPLLLSFALASVCGMWACLHIFYQEGATARCIGFANWTVHESFDWLGNSLTTGFKPEAGRWGAIAGAASGVVGLSWLRMRLPWFPLHPLGYCIGPGLIWMWFPFFIAWLCKAVILRYGGLRMYRRTLPFFLGLVLGEYTFGALWSLIGVLWNTPTHQIFH